MYRVEDHIRHLRAAQGAKTVQAVGGALGEVRFRQLHGAGAARHAQRGRQVIVLSYYLSELIVALSRVFRDCDDNSS